MSTSSLVTTETGLSSSRYEVRVLRDGNEKQVFWSRSEETGRQMLQRMHRFYKRTPGYGGSRLVWVSNKLAVEIVAEFGPDDRSAMDLVSYP
jgi:hypothetical protein